MEKKIEQFVSSVIDRERLVVEMWFGDKQIAELSNEPVEGSRIEIYCHEGEKWNFNLEDFYKSIMLAKSTLEGFESNTDQLPTLR